MNAPSNEDLASRIDRESHRAADTATTASSAESTAKTAKNIALIGVVLGALGLIVGIGALATRKRS